MHLAYLDNCFNHVRDDTSNTNVFDSHAQITLVNSIAERLRQAREAKGLTQGQLAKAASVSQGTIGNIESGARKAPRDLLALARALDVTPEWLQDGKGSRAAPSTDPASSAVETGNRAWPFKTITPEQLAEVPAATLAHIEQMIASFTSGAELPPDWRGTARRLAAHSDDLLGNRPIRSNQPFRAFVDYVDSEHDRVTRAFRQTTDEKVTKS